MRRIAKTKRIGHLGTLDPIATGVLPLVIGRATRLSQFYTKSDKIYEGQVRFRVHWSGGTYVRSIAHDLGQALGCGAHLAELRRHASGEFTLAQARTVAQLESLAADERLTDALVPAAEMLPGMPAVFVDDATVTQIRNGRNFAASAFRSQ